MINKLMNVLFGCGRNEATDLGAVEHGAEQERKRRKDTKMVDVAHEAMVERAAEDKATLEGLVRMGWPNVKREKFRSKVREKVWDVVKEDFGTPDDGMVEDITDSIVEVAEADERYAKMFDKGNA